MNRLVSTLTMFVAALASSACSSDDGSSGAGGAATSTAGAGGTGGSDSASATNGAGGAVGSVPSENGGGGAPSGEPGVRFVGRVDASDPSNVRFAWSGTGIVARFSGTSVAARLASDQQYTVLIDGELRPKLISSGRIEIIGDSITCGYGNEGPDMNCGSLLTHEAMATCTLEASESPHTLPTSIRPT